MCYFCRILEDFLRQKKEVFDMVKIILKSDEEDEARMATLSAEMQEKINHFQDFCHSTWHTLMHKELYLFEATEVIAK